MIFTPEGSLRQSPSFGAGEGEDEIDFAKVLTALRRRRRLALAMFGASLLSGALITVWQRTYRPIFEGSFKLLVSDPITNEVRQQGFGANDLETLALPSRGSADVATLIQVLGSPLLLSPIEQKLGLEDGDLEANTTITPAKVGARPGETGLLEINLRWHDPVEGRKILEELSRSYLSFSLRQRQEKLAQGLGFLDQQAPELQSRVMDLQNQMEEFRQRTGFVEPVEQATAIKDQQLELSENRKQLEQQQARLQGLAAAVRSGKLSGMPFQQRNVAQGNSFSEMQGTSNLAGGAFTSLLEDLTQVEKQLAEAEATYTEAAPQVQELRAKRNKLRILLQRRELDAIESSLGQNHAQMMEMWRQQVVLARQFQVNPVQMKQYDALQQQLVVARDNLTSYIKARESFRLQVAQRTVPWTVVASPKFGPRPTKPNVPQNLLISALLGGVAGVGLALLRDRLDNVFHSPKELQEGLAVPLLGVVPYLSVRTDCTISQSLAELRGGERFAINEALRNLFANFRLQRPDKSFRLVAITSSTQGEGNSTTVVLFAQTLAQLGQRVLLVDANMRRPMLHRYVGVHNQQGLSSVITDLDISLEGMLHTVQPGLDLLTAGPVPPDPTQLLSSERCGAVVQMIRNLPGYDLVVFDGPPALLLSDSVLLAEHLDGIIFMVGLSRVNRDLPVQALQRFRYAGLDVLGVVASQPVRSGSGCTRNSYGYGNYAAPAEQEAVAVNGEVNATHPSRT
jgi:succinoglycan biosynthesis transport protein ExoP